MFSLVNHKDRGEMTTRVTLQEIIPVFCASVCM